MENQQDTSTGLQANLAGLLCYILGWITGLIFFFIEKENKFIRFHAVQSIIVFGGLTVLSIVVSILQIIFMFILTPLAVLLGFVSTIIFLVGLALWILLMLKAYQNQTYKLPFLGEYSEKYSG